MPKKSLIITSVIILLLLGSSLFAYYYMQHRKSANLNKAQTTMVGFFKDTSFDISYDTSGSVNSTTSSALKGTMDKSLNFQGDILSKEIVVQNIIKVGDRVYTKAPTEDKWLVQQNPIFFSQINMISHPEYIELTKYTGKDTEGNLIYSVTFNQMSKTLFSKLTKEQQEQQKKSQLTGTATLNRLTGQLKEVKLKSLSQTPNTTTNEITIDYTENQTPPTITEPKI